MAENLKTAGLFAIWLLAGIGFVSVLGGWAMSKTAAAFIWMAGTIIAAMWQYSRQSNKPPES